ncbi:MAG TPA: RluA family pseudouridine synthase [Tepidisphaeraceae bacterium]|jgi:23S rRNA pseudouridine1911/1915/1917 synthase|nr:RluA family pseudouridine synthase [Tepidisphaeraceae bacterium]
MESQTLLDRLLKQYPQAKRQTLKRMVEAGRVRINGKRALRLKQPVAADDQLEVSDRPNKAPSPQAGSDLSIIYEDEDLLVIDKPAGLLTSTTAREWRPTLLAKVREYVKARQPRAVVGLIHRLDRDASGLLIFSKSDLAYRSLKTQFFHHTVVREYRAVVHGAPKPPNGRIESRLVERADGTVRSTRDVAKGQIAISDYQVLRTEGKKSLVRVVLQTGRKHQIRVQLAGLGNPVWGDVVYGPEKKEARLMLAATRLTVTHPGTGREMTFTAKLPDEFPLRES